MGLIQREPIFLSTGYFGKTFVLDKEPAPWSVEITPEDHIRFSAVPVDAQWVGPAPPDIPKEGFDPESAILLGLSLIDAGLQAIQLRGGE